MHEHHWEYHESSDEYSMTRIRRGGDGFPPYGGDSWYPSDCGQPPVIRLEGTPPAPPPGPGGPGAPGAPGAPGGPGGPGGFGGSPALPGPAASGPPAVAAAPAAGPLIASVNIYSQTPQAAPPPPPPPPPPARPSFFLRVSEIEFNRVREIKCRYELEIGPSHTIHDLMRFFDYDRYNTDMFVVWRGRNGGGEPLGPHMTPEQLRDNAAYLKVTFMPRFQPAYLGRARM